MCEICGKEFQNEKDMKDHMISHSYHKSDLLNFKCDECDFWGPNAQTMKMHFRRLHSENVSCGICDLEMKDIETLDIHTATCQRCNWCKIEFSFKLPSPSRDRIYFGGWGRERGCQFFSLMDAYISNFSLLLSLELLEKFVVVGCPLPEG